MENGLNMVDMHFISEKDAFKYNLEKDEMRKYGSCFEEYEYTWKIDNTDWWVVGINTKTNIVYAQIDQLSFGAIQDLELNNYALIGVVEEFEPGMISTRNFENPTKDIKEFIEEKMVYKLEYRGY